MIKGLLITILVIFSTHANANDKIVDVKIIRGGGILHSNLVFYRVNIERVKYCFVKARHSAGGMTEIKCPEDKKVKK